MQRVRVCESWCVRECASCDPKDSESWCVKVVGVWCVSVCAWSGSGEQLVLQHLTFMYPLT